MSNSIFEYFDPPDSPGVYIFRDGKKRPIYIGKAKKLSDRLASYRQKALPEKTMAMLASARSVEWIVFKTELEALLAEASMIRRYKPKYNIVLRDDKRFPMLLITDEPFPKVIKVRRAKKGTGRHYGPFRGETADNLLEIISRRFKIRRCKGPLPKRNRACIDFELGRCDAPCVNNISKENYLKLVESAEKLLSGNSRSLARELEDEMKVASAQKEFELAASLRNSASALRSLSEEQNVETPNKHDADAIAVLTNSNAAIAVFLSRRNGAVTDRNHYLFDIPLGFDDEEVYLQAVATHYGLHSLPRLLLIKSSLDEKKIITVLDAKNLEIKIPQKGDDAKFLELAFENARELLRISAGIHSDESRDRALSELANLLELSKPPFSIEAFDIATFSGRETVGASVRFHDALPWKQGYRQYRIRGRGDSDVDAIAETVSRRITSKLQLPDLILIDGGMGQLLAAQKAFLNASASAPTLISLEKKEETIRTIDGEVIKLPRDSYALRLLQFLRDEAHRFAGKYHRILMSKRK